MKTKNRIRLNNKAPFTKLGSLWTNSTHAMRVLNHKYKKLISIFLCKCVKSKISD